MATNEHGRDGATGQYVHTVDALCTCGHRLGEHTAARVAGEQPCLEAGCECQSFAKPRRRVARPA